MLYTYTVATPPPFPKRKIRTKMFTMNIFYLMYRRQPSPT